MSGQSEIARGRAFFRDRGRVAEVVQAMVASAFAIRVEAIRETKRGAAGTAFARQVGMYLVHTRLGLTYTATGLSFGRDRTTAAHACRAVEERRHDPRIDLIVDCLERAVDVWPEIWRTPQSIA